MRRGFLEGATCQILLLTIVSAGAAAPVTLSGSVSNHGVYSADTVYVVALDIGFEVATTVEYVAVAIGSPPGAVDYSISFDNTGVADSVLIGAILDVDGSGFDFDSLDNSITNVDVLGWYDGHQDPIFVDTSVSQTGLAFALPTAEIRGNVTFAQGQTWADIEACSVPNSWCPYTFKMQATGRYTFPGLYDGGWKVRGYGPLVEICYGDPMCNSPTEVSLAPGEVRSDIDLDFSVVAADAGDIRSGAPGVTIQYATNGVVYISYDVSTPSTPVRLTIYDVAGRFVGEIERRTLDRGHYTATWDGCDTRENAASRGIYFVDVRIGATRITEKVIIVHE